LPHQQSAAVRNSAAKHCAGEARGVRNWHGWRIAVWRAGTEDIEHNYDRIGQVTAAYGDSAEFNQFPSVDDAYLTGVVDLT
jgi:hypothetical protein